MNRLKIALDLDGVLANFEFSYNSYFKTDISKESQEKISKNVYKLRNNKEFWENLDVLERINFDVTCYCTKRINSKTYTKNWLIKNNFPNKPIYQMYHQLGNKATLIKGKCDVLIDDSVSNVIKCIKSGVPALLIDRPSNQWFGPQFRIYSLNYDEILEAYNLLIQYNGGYFI